MNVAAILLLTIVYIALRYLEDVLHLIEVIISLCNKYKHGWLRSDGAGA